MPEVIVSDAESSNFMLKRDDRRESQRHSFILYILYLKGENGLFYFFFFLALLFSRLFFFLLFLTLFFFLLIYKSCLFRKGLKRW